MLQIIFNVQELIVSIITNAATESSGLPLCKSCFYLLGLRNFNQSEQIALESMAINNDNRQNEINERREKRRSILA